MRENIKQKHSGQKSAPADLFPAAQSVKPIAGATATAAQIHALIDHPDAPTDSDLRRLANPNTGAPCFPAPVRGAYQLVATLAGLVRHHLTASRTPRADHPIYVSMEDAELRGLIPREVQKYAQRSGLQFINSNRSVNSEPLRRFLFDLLKKIFAKGGPDLKGIQGMEMLDKDTELAKKLREERIALEDDREIRDGRYVDKEIVDEAIYEQWLGPARGAIETSRKIHERETRLLIERIIATLPADAPENIVQWLKTAAHNQFLEHFKTLNNARYAAMLAKLRTSQAAPAKDKESA